MTTSIPVSTQSTRSIDVESRLLGTLTVPEDVCITFPEGLLGFNSSQTFVLLPSAKEGVFWLQSVDSGDLTFLVVDPFRYVEEFEFQFASSDRLATGLTDLSDAAVLAIVTLPRKRESQCTANLQGPLLVDFGSRRGWQIIQAESVHGTRHPIAIS